MSLIEAVAAGLLLLGSFLVIRAVWAADGDGAGAGEGAADSAVEERAPSRKAA